MSDEWKELIGNIHNQLDGINKRIEALEKKLEDVNYFKPLQDVNSLQEQIAELKEALNEVAQNRIGWEENIENNYRKLLKKYSECEDSTIHKSFFLGLLEKLDVGSARQTEIRSFTCPNCGMIHSHPDEFNDPKEEREASGGEKGLPNRENGLNHSYGTNGEPNAHHSKLPEFIEGWEKGYKYGKKKEKMTDDEIMRFNEEIMAKINKRKVQPLGEKTEPEKVKDPALNCFDCSEQIKHETEIKELIEEIQDDLDSLNPYIPYSYEPLNKIKEKWQGRIK